MPWCWRLTNLDPEQRTGIDLQGFDPLRLPGIEPLLRTLGIKDPITWRQHWRSLGGAGFQQQAWGHPVASDWVWGVALPLLTALEKHHQSGERRLIGLSGLPGCGKSTLASWLAQASLQMKLPVAVVSLDDFYWPGEELDRAMAGNPWQVPRALPGSHDLDLLESSLERWQGNGELRMPRFEKSLRGGRGDRSGWSQQSAEVVLLEGWFLGATPGKATTQSNEDIEGLDLTATERQWQTRAMAQLERYQPIWERLDVLWHLRAPTPSASRRWKEEQEEAMKRRTGIRLPGEALQGFVRMIEAAFPEAALQDISTADVVIHLTESRQIRELQLKRRCDQASESVSSTG